MEKMTKEDQAVLSKLGPCASNLTFELAQLYRLHHLAKKNHHHVVLGELYDDLGEDVDELNEQLLGAYAGIYTPDQILNSKKLKPVTPLNDGSEKAILAFLDSLTARAQMGLECVQMSSKLMFMQDTLSDILAAIYGAKYQIIQE